MDLAQGSINQAMLTMAELAARPDFRLGEASISPSARTVTGPGGQADLEPRVMQVLVVLADNAEQVVTRDTLFSRCWGGVYVGDDSLNRAIAGVRRVAENIASASFEIETVPRTGYRLIVKTGERPTRPRALEPAAKPSATRRALIGSAVAAAAAGAAGFLGWTAYRENSRFEELMARGEDAYRGETDLDLDQLIQTFEQAVALKPGSARAWGWLAFTYATSADGSPPETSARMTDRAQRAAARALEIDPRNPYALIAQAVIRGAMDGWAKYDSRLRQVLAIDPGNARAISILTVMLQGAGMNRESWAWNERAIALEPRSTLHLTRKALKLWILGRTAEADRVIDRVLELWPKDSWAQYVRFQLFALTGRVPAASTMLDGNGAVVGPPQAVSTWRASLLALERPTAAHIEDARNKVLQTAKLAPGLAAQGVMILAALKEVDAAFDVARGFLLSRGPIVLRHARRNVVRLGVNDPGWKWTPWLFTPPAAVMRADPRFLPLCEGIGLVDYWRERGVRPDYQLP